jgi:hypothetical protein
MMALQEEAPNKRLHSAQHDAAGRTMTDYVLSMLVAELTRVVADQQKRIEELEARLPAQAITEE